MNILENLGEESYVRQQVDEVITKAYMFTHDPSVLHTARENMAKKIASTTSGNNIYVEANGTCASNMPCYSTIQAAIDAASTGAIIKIAQGTYSENLTMSSSNKLTLQGGWDSTFTSIPVNELVSVHVVPPFFEY